MARAFPTPQANGIARPARTSTDSNQTTFAGETIAVTTAQLTLGALFGTVRVPKGAEIVGASLSSTDIDSGTAVTMELGDAGDTDRLLVASTIGQAGGVNTAIALTGYGYLYPDETLIQVRIAVAPGTAVAGTIRYGVTYVSQ